MEEKWKLEIIRWYIEAIENRKQRERCIHLLITQEEENDLIGKLTSTIQIKNLYNRSKRQVVEGALDMINLNTI